MIVLGTEAANKSASYRAAAFDTMVDSSPLVWNSSHLNTSFDTGITLSQLCSFTSVRCLQ